MTSTNIPTIVIVGGGAGGLNLATRLGRSLGKAKKAEIILVDENLSHLWKPSLHEFAAGTIGPDREISFLEHASRNNYLFRLGRFSGVNTQERKVMLEPVIGDDGVEISPKREVNYDYLVLSIGSRSNDFGTPGVAENCLFLDTPTQAQKLQSALLSLCLRFETGAMGADKNRLNISIVGGGATGVELSAEIREALDQFAKNGIVKLDSPDAFHISIIEAAPRLVSALPEVVSRKVEKHLTEIGVDVRTSSSVGRVDKDVVIMKSGEELPSDLSIWAAGIKAPAVIMAMDNLEHASLGRLAARQTLQSTSDDRVFVMGDCAACQWEGKDTTLPPRAQVASQQAKFLSKQLKRVLNGQELQSFRYVDRGSLVAISSYSAVGSLMGKAFGTMTIEGWLARLSYRYLHYDHEAAVQGHFRAAAKMFLSNAMRRVRPQLKLH